MQRCCLMALIIAFLLAGCGSPAPATSTIAAERTSPAATPATPTSVAEQTPPPALPEAPIVIAAQPSPSPVAPTTIAAQPSPSPTTLTSASPPTEQPQAGYLPPAEAQKVIGQTAERAILALKHKAMDTLAQMVQPQKGLTFAPYSPNEKSDRTLKAEELAQALNDPTVYTWGYYDGSGFPIDLTFAGYYDRFVYSQDFVNAPQIGYNQLIGGQLKGSSLEIFGPGIILVEYHFPGFDPKYEGMDWQSLYLVFQETDNVWYLVTIAHGEWGP